jgi:hypothetical protein
MNLIHKDNKKTFSGKQTKIHETGSERATSLQTRAKRRVSITDTLCICMCIVYTSGKKTINIKAHMHFPLCRSTSRPGKGATETAVAHEWNNTKK